MKKNGYGKIIKDGIITQNPVLVQVLGMCPTLAVSTQLMNGLGMGAAVTAVLIFSNLFISLLRKVIDKRVRIASFIVIIAGFVTMVEMLMKAFLPSLSESLGVYIPLIVVNCIILARAEAFASRNRPLPSVVDGLACGVGFTGAICIVSAIRELLGTGALLGYDFKLIPPIMIFTLAPGGLLVLGFVMAFCAWIGKRRRAKSAPAEASPVQGEVSPKATEGLSASEKQQSAPEAEAPVILSEAKDPTPQAETPKKEGDSSSARSRLLGMTETQSAPGTQPPVLGLGPQLEKREPARPVIEIVETAEAAEEIAPQSEALAPEASHAQGEASPKAPEGLSASEKPRSASGADNPSVIAAGGADSSPYTGEPRTSDARPYADRLQSEAEASVILSEAKDPTPQEETPKKEGDSSSARSRLLGMTEAPSAPETPSAPAGRAARRASSSHTQLTFDAAEDDDLEPPSFMSEPVTRLRDRDKKEGR